MLAVIYTLFASVALAFNIRGFHRAMVRWSVHRLVYGADLEVLPPKEKAASLTAQARVRAEAVRLVAQALFFAIGASALVAPLSGFTQFLVPFGFITAQVALALNGWMDDRSTTRIVDTLTPPGSKTEAP